MAIPLDAYRLDEIERSFEGFRTAVSYALFCYLYNYQPWERRKHFKQIGVNLYRLTLLARFKWVDFYEPVKTLRFAHPFGRVVYWHVQYILRLGGYLNDKSREEAI